MMKCLISVILSMLFVCPPVYAASDSETENNSGREFVMSCTYGVLAGTLVGAASLAFTSKPSDNLSRVARGASLGLYTGILLGVYVVYIVPGMGAEEEEDPVAWLDRVPVMVSPILHENRVDGLFADWTLLKF